MPYHVETTHECMVYKKATLPRFEVALCRVAIDSFSRLEYNKRDVANLARCAPHYYS